jgi:uncharacterized glyoxalase superfamily metalloenzyme YdcJ
MATTPPKTEPAEDTALAQAAARASESLARIEQRRKQVLDQRVEAIELTRTIISADIVRRTGGADLEPQLNEAARGIEERLQKIEEHRKQLAAAMKKARGGLPSGVKKRRAVAKG